MKKLKKALIHDWYAGYTGAEKCIESITNIWPDFDHYTLIDTLSEEERTKVLKGKKTNTSFIENLPFGKKKYRVYLPFFPFAIEQFDLTEYDIIISSSSSIAKGVLTRSDQLHISYVHSPIRYAWDLYFQYLNESGLNRGLKGFFAKYILHRIRIWDVSTANRPDFYIANSNYVAARIKKTYGKDSIVLYPPVDITNFKVSDEKKDYYITFSRMVPYKKIDIIVEAFSSTNKKLLVIGDGPDLKKIKKLSSQNIKLLGYLPKLEMIELLQKAKAFIFAAEEDFGIAPVEAQACGIPVIAFGKGGILETIKGVFPHEDSVLDKTGVFFKKQNAQSILNAITFFEKHEKEFDKQQIRANAENFSKEIFEKKFEETVFNLYEKWKNDRLI